MRSVNKTSSFFTLVCPENDLMSGHGDIRPRIISIYRSGCLDSSFWKGKMKDDEKKGVEFIAFVGRKSWEKEDGD